MTAISQSSFSVKKPPKKSTNSERRSREYLTSHEIDQIIAASRKVGRHASRDAALILLMYRHYGWPKRCRCVGMPSISGQVFCMYIGSKMDNPLSILIRGPELRALQQLRRHYPDTPYLFVSERGGPLTARAVRHIVLRAGDVAGLPFPIHPHMLRHACGFYLANKGIDTRAIQQYLGHRNIQHTVRYTALTPHRFTDFWDD